MSTFSFFPTKWDNHDTGIRIYGLLKNSSRPCCLIIKNFPSRVLIEFKQDAFINEFEFFEYLSDLLRKYNCEIYSKKILYLKKIMGVYINPDGTQRKFKLWEIYLSKNSIARKLKFLLNDSKFFDKIEIHEEWIDLWYQLALLKNISICKWLEISNAFENSQKQTICDQEFLVQIENIKDDPNQMPPPPIPIVAYDIEVYTHFETRYENRFPNAKEPNDCIFMISMVFENLNDEKLGDKFVLMITTCNLDINLIQIKFPQYKIEIIRVKSEICILEKFNECLTKYQPLLIFGYNNLSFDHAYMISRAEEFQCWSAFQNANLSKYSFSLKKEVSWSSSARPDEKFVFVQGEGFTFGDVFTLIKKDYKLESYSLNAVATKFLKNENKHDVTPKQMTCIYKLSLSNSNNPNVIEKLSEIASYCIQDSVLVLKLLDQLKYISSLIALSNLTNCKIEDLIIRGTLQKVLSLIIRFSKSREILVQRIDKNKESNVETFRGATVFTPIYGVHRNLISLDFASLYPSLIEAYNLCASTLVNPGDNSIPLDKCSVYEWDDHVGCIHDPNYNVEKIKSLEQQISLLKSDAYLNHEKFPKFIQLKKELISLKDAKPNKQYCVKRRYVFYNGYEGVYPQIVKMLKSARKEIKKKMDIKKAHLEKLKKEQVLDKELNLLLTNEVVALNAEQLAVKVIANSLYGFTGATTSSIPSIPIAACITYLGRTNIEKASQIIKQDFGGLRVYGDTDSNYIKLSDGLTFKELDLLGKEISNVVSNKFPDCLRIEYEGEIYAYYLIINKKQYCYLVMNEDGTIKDKMGAKGLLLVKRDNCAWVRECYEKVIRLIFQESTFEQIEKFIIEQCLNLIYRQVPIQKLTITKQVGDWGNKKTHLVAQKTKMGKYTIRTPNAEKLNNFLTIEDYNISALPAHIQLANRMTELGIRVTAGERIQYIVTGIPTKLDIGMGQKIQTINIFENNNFFKIDFLYYIKLLISNLNTILDIVFPREFNFKPDKLIVPKTIYFQDEIFIVGNDKEKLENIEKFKKKLMTIYKDNFLKGKMFSFLDQIKKKIELHEELMNLIKPKFKIIDNEQTFKKIKI